MDSPFNRWQLPHANNFSTTTRLERWILHVHSGNQQYPVELPRFPEVPRLVSTDEAEIQFRFCTLLFLFPNLHLHVSRFVPDNFSAHSKGRVFLVVLCDVVERFVFY